MTHTHHGTCEPISQYFGSATLGVSKLKQTLPKETYAELVRSIEQGKKISRQSADVVAQAIREWAVANGVTHYCHWFQPMNGLTAEKHDAFITTHSTEVAETRVIERFTGAQLIQGEPDASSFPSGGMRSTFEARGYTAWDPNVPLFYVEGPSGTKTLCIPSVFFGYHGDSLDNKTPLLRSCQSLNREAIRFLKLLGDVDVRRVYATLGAEQEYFLLDRKMVKKRPDLLVAGRTLFGAPCTKGQKLADHYFGSIPERALAFMEDLERELFRLGVPVRTRHNEVAPCQYEMAPIFEPIPLAVDHSALIMETMVRVGARHDLYVCFHEKPFADLNGSGKHCNWSLANDRQENLLDPGRTPHQNLRFLALIAVVIQAIHQHGSCLGAFVASPGNDLRLGSNEAPPAIISVFLGGMLEKIYTDLLRGELTEMTESEIINLGVSHIPDISRDYTDRNRTSPFAFTGNKFEFRAVGASANPAVSMAALNGAVASAFADCASQLSSLLESGRRRDEAVIQLIRNVLERHQAVLYSGNNYSKEWRTEAKNRGLSEVNRVEDSLATLSDPKHVQFLVDMHVLTPAEITSRVVVRREQFVATTIVETETFLQMVSEFVLPSLEAHLSAVLQLDTNVRSRKLKDRLATRVGSFEGTLSDVLAWYDATRETLTAITGEANHETAVNVIRDRLRNQIAQLRSAVDQAEMIVGDSYWRLPRYRDLLYVSAVQ